MPLDEVRGEFQGRPYVVRLGHLSAEPNEQQGAPTWWIVEFEASARGAHDGSSAQ